MSGLLAVKQRLRRRSEYFLRLAALRELGAGQPATTAPHPPRGGLLWRMLFVPVYRRIPWTVKYRAMRALGMTASGWKPPPRHGGEPWRPPREAGERLRRRRESEAPAPR
jgi:hypothetical protein